MRGGRSPTSDIHATELTHNQPYTRSQSRGSFTNRSSWLQRTVRARTPSSFAATSLIDVDLASLARPNSRTSTSWALRILGIAACVGLFLTIAYIPGGISEPRSSATRLGGTSSSAVTHAKSKKWAHGYDEDEYFELPDDLEAAIAELIIDDDLIASLGAARDDEIIPGVEPRIEGTTDEGVVVSTKGGQNTTLLRIKMLQEMQEGGGYQH